MPRKKKVDYNPELEYKELDPIQLAIVETVVNQVLKELVLPKDFDDLLKRDKIYYIWGHPMVLCHIKTTQRKLWEHPCIWLMTNEEYREVDKFDITFQNLS